MSAVVVMETITKSPLFEEDEVVQRPGVEIVGEAIYLFFKVDNDVYIDVLKSFFLDVFLFFCF